MLFEFLAYLTGLAVVALVVLAWFMHRDPFHPLICIGPTLVFLYAYLPLYLSITQREELRGYLADGDLVYVQSLNGLGAIALCLGILFGSAAATAGRPPPPSLPSDDVARRLAAAAVLLGLVGLAAYGYMLANVGGFAGAYGRAYGGVWADSGYVRDLQYLTIAALLLLLAARTGRRLSGIDWCWLALFASPWLIHGLLGARRGPTFMVLVALGAGWYFARGRRPRLATTMVGGLALGLLLLFLVAHRGQIYLGSDFDFGAGAPTFAAEVGSGNEFVYGAGAILHADAMGEYWWGRRYATVLLVRPIPRFLWPSKYDDAAAVLGTPSIQTNMGVGTDALRETVGWVGATGAAPGIVADLWIEFSWASLLAILGIGWCYGRAWARAVRNGGLWVPIYCALFALSIFLVMQSLEAMLFRFLLLAVPALLAWWYAGGVGRALNVPDHVAPGSARAALNARSGHPVPSPGPLSSRPAARRRRPLSSHRDRAVRGRRHLRLVARRRGGELRAPHAVRRPRMSIASAGSRSRDACARACPRRPPRSWRSPAGPIRARSRLSCGAAGRGVPPC